jgi:hypothetical protein
MPTGADVVAWVMFDDGTGAADLAGADEASVVEAVSRMVEERGRPAKVSGTMSLAAYKSLREEALGRGADGAKSLGELLLGGEEVEE